MLVHVLPAINATLNGTSGVLLVIAYVLIRRKNIRLHRRFMIAACSTSALFLCGYGLNHWLRHGVVTHFTAQGIVRPVYFSILISHTILAIIILPLVIITLRYGLRMSVRSHRAIARWTFPIWMYVSVTGVLVYFFLYQWFPSSR